MSLLCSLLALVVLSQHLLETMSRDQAWHAGMEVQRSLQSAGPEVWKPVVPGTSSSGFRPTPSKGRGQPGKDRLA